MALLQEQPAASEAVDADALIREARRLRRRRWLIGLAATLIVVGGSGLGYGLAASGGQPPDTTGHPAGDLPSAAPSVVARWTDLSTGGGLPAGAQITSVVRFDGRLIAAGDYFGGGAALAGVGCSVGGCNPVVWTSKDGSHWSIALAENATGSVPGERLVATPRGLLMFNTAEASTSLWQSSNGGSWYRVTIPNGMSGLNLSGVTWGHGRLVAIFYNKFAGGPDTAYGNADTIWTSTDGITWRQDSVPGTPQFTSLTTTPSGFLASGTSRATGRPALWRSSNGLTWSTSAVAVPKGELLVSANGNDLVAEDGIPGLAAAKAAVQLWWSTNGRTWMRAVVRSGPISPPQLVNVGSSPLAATSDGFVVSGKLPTNMWSSSTGGTWSPVIAKGVPSTKYQVQELFPDGSGLLAVAASTNTHTSASVPTTSLWYVGFTPAR